MRSRFPKDLIEGYKKIAEFRGMAYQPLMREALRRFAHQGFKRMAMEYVNIRAVKK